MYIQDGFSFSSDGQAARFDFFERRRGGPTILVTCGIVLSDRALTVEVMFELVSKYELHVETREPASPSVIAGNSFELALVPADGRRSRRQYRLSNASTVLEVDCQAAAVIIQNRRLGV